MRHYSLHNFYLLCVSATLSLVHVGLVAAAELPLQPMLSDRPVSGLVTAIKAGATAIGTSDSPGTRALHLGDVVRSGEEVRVSEGGSVDILWDRRALLTLQDDAHVIMSETNRGQTHAEVKHGTVRVALSYGSGRMTDVFSVDTPQAHMVARGGILEARVVASERRSLVARLMQSAASETLRVIEGQARVEPLAGGEKPFALKAGLEVSLKGGVRVSSSEFHADHQPGPSLAVREEHRMLAAPVVKHIVNAQVGHVLELEKALSQTPQVGDKEPFGSTVKGTIVSTSFGVPSLFGSPAGSSAASTSATAATPAAATFTVPTAPGPVAAPPVAAVSPPVTAVSPSQSGGLNTSALLQQIVNSVVGNQGKGNGKGPKHK